MNPNPKGLMRREEMAARVKGRVVDLSMHKFSSNLIEKCLLYGADAERDAIVAEMLAPRGGPNPYPSGGPSAYPGAPDDDNIALNEMVRDQYANFVVGRALEVCARTPEL